jgi:hypothetical protein
MEACKTRSKDGSRMIEQKRASSRLPGLLVGALMATGGCGQPTANTVELANRTLGPMTVAVAPAFNVSGAKLDTNRIADLMASELSYAANVNVLPVSRVLAVLVDQNKSRVESPSHAMEIMRILGADAILVFAVTEYDAYEPPIVGISAQIYGTRRSDKPTGFDPVAFGRLGAPPRGAFRGTSMDPIAQSDRVFDASHERVRSEIKRFSKIRSADESPYGWRKYLASQQHFIRFCCYQTIRSMISGKHAEIADSDPG